MKKDHGGRPLPNCRVIGHGEIFLMNPHAPASLDGRYLERSGFGTDHPLTWPCSRGETHARAEHLAADGLAGRQGPSTVPQRDLLATLRRRELDAVGASLSNEIGMPYAPPAAGELAAGTFRRRLTLSSGRFALIDNGLGFGLVPWPPALDRHLGHHGRRRRQGERRDRVEFPT